MRLLQKRIFFEMGKIIFITYSDEKMVLSWSVLRNLFPSEAH